MKFMLFVLPTVPGTLEDRKRLRPIGRNNERYQQTHRRTPRSIRSSRTPRCPARNGPWSECAG